MNKELKELYNYLVKLNLKSEALNVSKFVKTASGFVVYAVEEITDSGTLKRIAKDIRNKAFPSDSIFDKVIDDPEMFLENLEAGSLPEDGFIGKKKPNTIKQFYTRKPFGKSKLQVNNILSGVAKSAWNDYDWEIFYQSKTVGFEGASFGEYNSGVQSVSSSITTSGVEWCRYKLNMEVYIDDDVLYPDIYYTLKDLVIEIDTNALKKAKKKSGGSSGSSSSSSSSSTSTVSSNSILSYQQLILENVKSKNLKVGIKDGDIIEVKSKDREIDFVLKFKDMMDDVLDFLEANYKKEESEYGVNYAGKKGAIDDMNPEYTATDKGVYVFIIDYFERLQTDNKLKSTHISNAVNKLIADNGYKHANGDFITGPMASFLSSVLSAPAKKKSTPKKKTPHKHKKKPSSTVPDTDPIEELNWDFGG